MSLSLYTRADLRNFYNLDTVAAGARAWACKTWAQFTDIVLRFILRYVLTSSSDKSYDAVR